MKANKNWRTYVIILTTDKKLALDLPFLTADKNWHQNIVFKSRGKISGKTTLVTTTTTAYHEEDIDLETDLEAAAIMKQRIEK